jgi:uncharacterized protein YcsI (UPF0317 family)
MNMTIIFMNTKYYECLGSERRFMLTRRGYLGSVPDNSLDNSEESHARIGDLVAIVFGCSTTFSHLLIRLRYLQGKGNVSYTFILC